MNEYCTVYLLSVLGDVIIVTVMLIVWATVRAPMCRVCPVLLLCVLCFISCFYEQINGDGDNCFSLQVVKVYFSLVVVIGAYSAFHFLQLSKRVPATIHFVPLPQCSVLLLYVLLLRYSVCL